MSDKQHIIDLEKRFWDTMISKDVEKASAVMANKSIVIGPRGVSQIAKGDFAEMMEEGQWTLEKYRFSGVEVLFPTDSIAVIGYKVKQSGTMNGKPYALEAADASTWTRSGGEWHCVLHTETPIGQS